MSASLPAAVRRKISNDELLLSLRDDETGAVAYESVSASVRTLMQLLQAVEARPSDPEFTQHLAEHVIAKDLRSQAVAYEHMAKLMEDRLPGYIQGLRLSDDIRAMFLNQLHRNKGKAIPKEELQMLNIIAAKAGIKISRNAANDFAAVIARTVAETADDSGRTIAEHVQKNAAICRHMAEWDWVSVLLPATQNIRTQTTPGLPKRPK